MSHANISQEHKPALQVKLSNSTGEAKRISEFFLSDVSFDDTRHTPGELEHFREAPLRSIGNPKRAHWYVENEAGDIVGVTSCHENEHQTDGYLWDYLVVHRDYRRHGIATQMFRELEWHVAALGARYILTYTCSLPEYLPVQQLFQKHGFKLIGQYPDYYYEGEDRLAYMKKITPR
jgi:GNAT superfamily N-acetyltransferase